MMAVTQTDRIDLNALADGELDVARAGDLRARLAADAAPDVEVRLLTPGETTSVGSAPA